MSAYAPALFVSRQDGAPLAEQERETILRLARAAAATVRLKDERSAPVRPRVHDHDGYEPGALGILLYSGYAYRMMSQELQREQDEAWTRQSARVGADIDRRVPGVSTFTGYGAED